MLLRRIVGRDGSPSRPPGGSVRSHLCVRNSQLEFTGEAAFSNVWKTVVNRTATTDEAKIIQLKVGKMGMCRGGCLLCMDGKRLLPLIQGKTTEHRKKAYFMRNNRHDARKKDPHAGRLLEREGIKYADTPFVHTGE